MFGWYFPGKIGGIMHRLENHAIIGLDLDSTLIDAGDYSRMLTNFVKKNPHKLFHIITFRDLYTWSYDATVIEIQDKTGLVFEENFVSLNFLPEEEETDEYNFEHWKGWLAAQLKCTIFVDDRPEWVEAGCNHHGVEFIDTFDLRNHNGINKLG